MTFTNQSLANIWGYAAGGHEYALVGAQNGMVVVDVTNPDAPTQIVQIPGPNSEWREIETYSHYAYIVSEAGLGVQIVDLTNLPNSNLAYHSYYGDGAINNQLNKGHSLHVDEVSGFLYVYGSNLFGGKPVVINLNIDPYNPTYSNYVNFIGYVHDGYVYNDMFYPAYIYQGEFGIVNMANKSNPVLIATQNTPGLFTHNTWINGNILFTTDEVSNSFLSAYDISNTSNITLLDKIQSNPGSGSIVHNTHIWNNYAITSWYKDGFTIVDVTRPANLVQTGNYDTYPSGSGNGFNGCWGVYPFLPSGTIIASNIDGSNPNNGELYVCTPTYVRGCYLEGAITNSANGNPINGASIQILSTTTQDFSGATGLYKVGQLQSGTFTVQVSKTGYYTHSSSATLTNGVLTILNVALVPIPPVPIELVRFTARAAGKDAILDWETASEANFKGFEVQESQDAYNWHAAGWVDAKGPSQYELRLPDLASGRWFFRLRQVETDGSATFSPVQEVEILPSGLHAALTPNAVRDQAMLSVSVTAPANVQVDVYDARMAATGLHWTLQAEGEVSLALQVGQLPAGTYYAVVRTENDRVVVPFVKGGR